VDLRRRLLAVDPSGVRDDLDAAARCECSCHPRPGGRVHPDGVCACQLTRDEQAERLRVFEHAIAAVHEQNSADWDERAAQLEQVAAELGVEAVERVPAAPWVISGFVDGRAFYMRERWDVYSIVIAPDDRPGLDVWSMADEPGVVVREGPVTDLVSHGGRVDYRVALPFVVAAVRADLRRRTCPHPARPGDDFCPRCGSPVVPVAPAPGSGREAECTDSGSDVEEFVASVDPETMRSGAHLVTLGGAWVAFVSAEQELTRRLAEARAGGESWSVLSVVLGLSVSEARDRFESKVGE
jgi:hypothetical protein